MKRLRHPVRAIREPFGTAGLIIACLALVAALGGSALAASGALSGKQKKEVEKIAKKFAGKPGANGTNGSNGAAGAKGDAGAAGTPGSPGTAGASVTEAAATSAECSGVAGGVKYTLSGVTTKVCNGKPGTTGFTAVLPPGETETGAWAASSAGTLEPLVSLSFPIPLEDSEAITEAAFVPDGPPPATGPCVGGTLKAPVAAPGSLCVYAGEAENSAAVTELLIENVNGGFLPPLGTSKIGGPGALISPVFSATGQQAAGSWAVTAPE